MQQNKYFRDKSADSQSNFYSSAIMSNNFNIMTSKGQLMTSGGAIPSQSKNVNVSKSTLVAVIDNLNLNRNSTLKDEGSSNFKKKIDKLNLKFYVETEKYLNNQNDMDRCQDKLFIILFRQISTYNEEVERLNSIIRDLKNQIGISKSEEEKIDNIIAHNNTLRGLNKEMEKKLNEKSTEELKHKTENESLKAQIKVLKDKLQTELKKSLNNVDINTTYSAQSTQSNKKGVSSDKLVSLSLSDLKDKEDYKPTLSMTNFHKKNSKTVPSVVGNAPTSSTGSTQIQISSVTECCTSASNTETDSSQTDPLNLTSSNFKAKKRNHSDNDPQPGNNNLIKSQKDLGRVGDRWELTHTKINLVADSKIKETSSANKKQPVRV